MSEPTTRELYDKINEMAVALGIVNTKMDFVLESKKTAEEAKLTADKAYEMAQDNETEIQAVEERVEKKIDGIKKTAMWAIGLTITALISLTAIIVSVAF